MRVNELKVVQTYVLEEDFQNTTDLVGLSVYRTQRFALHRSEERDDE
jgi:hypothetical protein